MGGKRVEELVYNINGRGFTKGAFKKLARYTYQTKIL